LISSECHLYDLRASSRARLGIVTGDVRQVTCAQVWVNSENTNMSMADPYDNSISGIIRYEGGRKNSLGQLTENLIGDQLDRTVAGRRPVPPCAAVVTGPGELRRNGVRWIVHTAAVLGQPGEGYRQVRDIGRCATKALAAVDNGEAPLGETVLLPLLGTGHGRGNVDDTVRALVQATISYLIGRPHSAIRNVYLLAHTDHEFAVCRKAFAESRLLSPSQARPRPDSH
jgi:hypothetical protein